MFYARAHTPHVTRKSPRNAIAMHCGVVRRSCTDRARDENDGGGHRGDDGAANGLLLAKPLLSETQRIDPPPPHIGRPLVVMTQSNRCRRHRATHSCTSLIIPPHRLLVFFFRPIQCAARLPCDLAACSSAAVVAAGPIARPSARPLPRGNVPAGRFSFPCLIAAIRNICTYYIFHSIFYYY